MWDGTGTAPHLIKISGQPRLLLQNITEENQVYAGLEYLEKICAKKEIVLDFEYLC